LLILDNCEHLVEACAELVDALMAGCPDLRIIATSRETLRIPGEVWWPVPPLGIPDGQSEGSVGDYDAVQLFVDRAAAVRKGFAVTQGNAADNAELCRQLDGIPLAIELAAARLDILDAGQILERLDQRFRLLTQGSRTAPGRHRTLEAAISSSHDLLDEPERVLFRRLSVFAGEFSLSAAEQACGGDPIDEFEVIERLSSLRRKSLVEVAQPTEGAARYRMLGSLREYGRERLVEADELDEISARHAGHYLTRAEEAHPHLYGRGRRAWLEALELEMDNLRAAMSWALANDSAIAGRFAASLGEFWYVRGHWNEGRDLLEQTLALGDALDAGIRAKALLFAGRFAYRQVDYPRAAALGEEALKLSRAADEPRDVAGALRLLGDIAWGEERLDDAREHAAESLAISREVDDQRGIAASLTSLATVAGSRGDNDLSLSLTDESLVIWRALGDDREVAGGLSRLGGVALGQGRIEEARACYIESLDLFRDAGDQSDAAMALNSLGEVALRQGESEQAHACFSEGEETLTKLGDPRGVCWSRGGLARAATIRGDHEASRAYWAACVGPLREVGYPRGIAVSKLGFADACRALDDWDGALDAYRESLEIARSLDD
ncbi:MAG TPA: tetratricopeptide repeat protein, partial [Armatimonadota bacterium]|nr:tetratricopeptide repeat protein [Armatimonadota bacterium]